MEMPIAEPDEVTSSGTAFNIAQLGWWYNFFRNFGNGRIKSLVKAIHQEAYHRTRVYPKYWR
jgi:hypothetical protein